MRRKPTAPMSLMGRWRSRKSGPHPLTRTRHAARSARDRPMCTTAGPPWRRGGGSPPRLLTRRMPLLGPGLPHSQLVEAGPRRRQGIVAGRSNLVLLTLVHPPREDAFSTPFGATPRLAGSPRHAGDLHLLAYLSPRWTLGLAPYSRRVPRGLDSSRALSRVLAFVSRKEIVDKAYVMSAKGIIGMRYLDGAVGPVATRGMTKVWMTKRTMTADPLTERRLCVVATPRGASLRAACPSPPLPSAVPILSSSVVGVALALNLVSTGVPPCGIGPLITPPHYVLLLRSGGIMRARPPRYLLSPRKVACFAVTGGTSALQRTSWARSPLSRALRALVMSRPSCRGWGRLLLDELITGFISGQSLRGRLVLEFGGGGLRLGRRVPPRRATQLTIVTFLVT